MVTAQQPQGCYGAEAPRLQWCSPCRRHNCARGNRQPRPAHHLHCRPPLGAPAACRVARGSGVVLNAPQVLSSHIWLNTTCRLQARGGPAGALVPVCLLTKDLAWTNASSLDSARCSVYRKQAGELTGRGPTSEAGQSAPFPSSRRPSTLDISN